MATREQYEAAFAAEAARTYPAVDAFECDSGYAMDSERLERMARVLACPVKANPPNWQHGRIIYAALRRFISGQADLVLNRRSAMLLDIGTAKGFSALCMAWAAFDAKHEADIVSLDVVGPNERVLRNSIADTEPGAPKTVRELVAPFCPAGVEAIEFYGVASQRWLAGYRGRIDFAFIDGKHSFAGASLDAQGVSMHQRPGDMIVFDDVQIDSVRRAVKGLLDYEVEEIEAHPGRRYAIATKQ